MTTNGGGKRRWTAA